MRGCGTVSDSAFGQWERRRKAHARHGGGTQHKETSASLLARPDAQMRRLQSVISDLCSHVPSMNSWLCQGPVSLCSTCQLTTGRVGTFQQQVQACVWCEANPAWSTGVALKFCSCEGETPPRSGPRGVVVHSNVSAPMQAKTPQRRGMTRKTGAGGVCFYPHHSCFLGSRSEGKMGVRHRSRVYGLWGSHAF